MTPHHQHATPPVNWKGLQNGFQAGSLLSCYYRAAVRYSAPQKSPEEGGSGQRFYVGVQALRGRSGHLHLDIFPSRTVPPPFLHGVGHSTLLPPPDANLRYKAIYRIIVYKADSA